MNRKRNNIRAGWTALCGGYNHSANPSRDSVSRISFFHGVIAMNIEGISNALCRLGTGNKGVIAMNLSRTRKL